MMIMGTKIRVGTIIKFEGQLYRCTYIMHRTPGNKRGFVQTKLRNLTNNKVIDYRFGSDDKVESPSLDFREMEYLYAENDMSLFHFMDTRTFDQMTLGRDVIEDFIPYLKDNMKIVMGFYEGKPLTIQLPTSMEFKVATTQPELKGATATNSFKPATLENGVEIMVPPFIKEGDMIVIDPEAGEYLSRV